MINISKNVRHLDDYDIDEVVKAGRTDGLFTAVKKRCPCLRELITKTCCFVG
jgi:hypothetical protein